MIYRVGVEMNRWPIAVGGNVIFMNLTFWKKVYLVDATTFYKTKIVSDVRV